MASSLKQGQIVYLKCGGPPMVLDVEPTEREAVCVWLDKSWQPQRQSYSVDSLTLALPSLPMMPTP